MLQYHVAYHLPAVVPGFVVAKVLGFPGVFSQGFDLPDARQMIASALERGRALPVPHEPQECMEADRIERMPLSIEVSALRRL